MISMGAKLSSPPPKSGNAQMGLEVFVVTLKTVTPHVNCVVVWFKMSRSPGVPVFTTVPTPPALTFICCPRAMF